MIINPGTLKHPITILRYSEEIDNEGFKKKDWMPILICRAALMRIKIKDAQIENITTSRNFIECIIRFTQIQHTDKIEINGIQYNIHQIEDIDFLNRFLRITLK